MDNSINEVVAVVGDITVTAYLTDAHGWRWYMDDANGEWLDSGKAESRRDAIADAVMAAAWHNRINPAWAKS